MSMADATVLMVDMLMAGIDTVNLYLQVQIFYWNLTKFFQTSHTTAFLLYFLAKKPEKQEKLRDEILSIVGSKDSRVTPKALNELRYLKACVKETLRSVAAAHFYF